MNVLGWRASVLIRKATFGANFWLVSMQLSQSTPDNDNKETMRDCGHVVHSSYPAHINEWYTKDSIDMGEQDWENWYKKQVPKKNDCYIGIGFWNMIKQESCLLRSDRTLSQFDDSSVGNNSWATAGGYIENRRCNNIH